MKIVRTSEVDWSEGINRGSFSQRRKPLGGKALACGLWELAPGKKSFPFHKHLVTEEAMYVLAGSAKVRTSGGEVAIGPGDFLSFEPGGDAHQLVNDGAEPLLYFAVSAPKGCDVVEYPDSHKVAASVGVWPDVKRFIFKSDAGVDYFDGEPDA